MLNAPSAIRIAEDVAAVPQAPVRLPVARRGHEGPGRLDVGHIHGKKTAVECSLSLKGPVLGCVISPPGPLSTAGVNSRNL